MILYKHISDIQQKLNSLKQAQQTIGFVATMGALHNGHLSLIKASKQQNDVTVCSIFVNPTQFNDKNDFANYPVTIEKDILQLTEAGADILFLPSVAEMYPEGTTAPKHYELGRLETILEGKYRPGHFQGVCQVVHRLFQVIQPGKAYFGQKDYQQCMVIKKLVATEQLSVEIVVHPTVREKSGLAMSSRNMRLDEAGKKAAIALYKALVYLKDNANNGNAEKTHQEALQMLADAGFEKTDYLEIADAQTLEPITTEKKEGQKVAIGAAYLNGIRLIDNLLF